MAGSSFTELHQKTAADMSELTADLERMIENTEKISRMASLYQACDGRTAAAPCGWVVLSCVHPQYSWLGWLTTLWLCGPTPNWSPRCRSWRTLIRDAELRSVEPQSRTTAPLPLQELIKTDWYMSVCPKLLQESLPLFETFFCSEF